MNKQASTSEGRSVLGVFSSNGHVYAAIIELNASGEALSTEVVSFIGTSIRHRETAFQHAVFFPITHETASSMRNVMRQLQQAIDNKSNPFYYSRYGEEIERFSRADAIETNCYHFTSLLCDLCGAPLHELSGEVVTSFRPELLGEMIAEENASFESFDINDSLKAKMKSLRRREEAMPKVLFVSADNVYPKTESLQPIFAHMMEDGQSIGQILHHAPPLSTEIKHTDIERLFSSQPRTMLAAGSVALGSATEQRLPLGMSDWLK